jgi:hypothetical protein
VPRWCLRLSWQLIALPRCVRSVLLCMSSAARTARARVPCGRR